MRGLRQNQTRRAAFDRATRIHDNDLVAQLRRQPQVVGDENDRGTVLLLHLGNQAEDRRMYGRVQRGRRLVAMTRRGLLEKANAISTRWHMPPDN